MPADQHALHQSDKTAPGSLKSIWVQLFGLSAVNDITVTVVNTLSLNNQTVVSVWLVSKNNAKQEKGQEILQNLSPRGHRGLETEVAVMGRLFFFPPSFTLTDGCGRVSLCDKSALHYSWLHSLHFLLLQRIYQLRLRGKKTKQKNKALSLSNGSLPLCVQSTLIVCQAFYSNRQKTGLRRSWIMNVFGPVCAIAGQSEPLRRSNFIVILLCWRFF